jgi:hypothetical protein
MGMYDTINGEQVKCFPWVSLYLNKISYHGGDLKYYGIGSKVPYKKPHYNYGKNFIILDMNRFPESDYCCYDYILHVIVNGKVKKTFKDEIGKINWAKNENVIGYWGELLNINSSEDILSFIKEQREYKTKYDEINSHWDELFGESMQYLHGIALLDKDSEEKKFRQKKIDEILKLMDEEKERIQPELDELRKKHSSKWFVDTSDIDDLVLLGEYISAYETELQAERDNAETCKEMIEKLLSSDDTLYDRYVVWQGSDGYIKEFKL